MIERDMSYLLDRRVASAVELVGLALLGPLLAPAGLVALRLVTGLAAGAPNPPPRIAAEWQMLALFGPAIPVYVALLPLLPFGVMRLRRGWRPRLSSLLAACIAIGLLIDAFFYLAADRTLPDRAAAGTSGTSESRAAGS